MAWLSFWGRKQGEAARPDPLSLDNLIGWLETKDPVKEYSFSNTYGECLYSQYLVTLGYCDGTASSFLLPSKLAEESREFWKLLHVGNTYDIAASAPFTFGGALDRAKALRAREAA